MTASDDSETSFRKADWPFYWLTRASALYLANIESALKKIGLDVPRWRVLMSIHESGCASVGEIAEQAIVKLPTMTKIIQRMQSDGLVHCRPRATDARVTEVLLTPAGLKAREQAWHEAERVYGRAFGSIANRDVTKLNQILARVFDNLQKI
ncbi:MarR family winged helix-turn-helix transcriptional regulator [Caulobacter sp. 602-1]|uniref:MarR family winged helix-turn-helix transcriptional regulator n=1 Tax=Caulobacter sp. 602-1 TaxID=2492472 RepID=UPI000F62FCB7|nr:MarR family transcriptional regulator [Caulobacter sp. 602-1]RRN63814.1 MarR family transcriptional regulator [Caulobacter sp. 602-1]